jgi:hypothetical protein
VSRPQAAPRETREALAAALLSHPLVGPSTLAGAFRQSRGFALTFTRGDLPRVQTRFGFLAPYLEWVLTDRALLPFGGALRAFWPNAFYLNLLLLDGGAGVGRHVDATLRAPSGEPDAVPQRVSVLYLRAPGEGGALSLHRGDRPVARLQPVAGDGLHFRGDLGHEVEQVEGLRASLVCEQYRLPARALARLGPPTVQSKAGFAAFLQATRGQPGDRPETGAPVETEEDGGRR